MPTPVPRSFSEDDRGTADLVTFRHGRAEPLHLADAVRLVLRCRRGGAQPSASWVGGNAPPRQCHPSSVWDWRGVEHTAPPFTVAFRLGKLRTTPFGVNYMYRIKLTHPGPLSRIDDAINSLTGAGYDCRIAGRTIVAYGQCPVSAGLVVAGLGWRQHPATACTSLTVIS
jgi:hypothetical protein